MSKKKNKSNNIKKNNELEVKEIKSDDIEEYYNILDQEKPNILLKILLLIVLFIIGIFLVYTFVIKDDKSIFSSGINRVYEISANKIVKLSKSEIFNSQFDLSGVFTLNTTNEDYSDLNDTLFNIDFKLDKLNNKYLLDVESKENDNLQSHTKYYYLDNNYYLDLGNIYDKIIKLNSNIFSLDSNIINYSEINFNKLNSAFKGIKNIIVNNINRDNLETKEININNTNYIVVTLKLDKSSYSSLISKITYDIKENNTIMNNLVGAFNSDYESINNYLDDINKNNLNNSFNEISFSFYSSGIMSSIMGMEINIDDSQVFKYLEEKDESTLNIKYDNYELYIYNKDNKYSGKLLKDDTLYIEMTFKELNDDVIDLDYKNYEDNSYGNFHLNKYSESNNTSGNIKYSIVSDSETSSFNFDYRFEKYSDISITEDIINQEDIEEKETIIKNIKYSFPNKKLQEFYLKALD